MKAIIVGAGKLGQKLAESMIQEDIDLTVIDSKPDVIERINEHLDCLTIVANGLDISNLRDLGIQGYDMLVACTDSDETNTVICILAKKLGCKRTVARIRNPEYKEQLDFVKKEMGIDYIINPDLSTAVVIEKYLLKSYSFHSGDFADGQVIMVDYNIGIDSKFVGKKLMELDIFRGMLVVAIFRDGDIIIPYGGTELNPYDTIHVIGKTNEIDRLGNILHESRKNKKVERVMILGGSNIGYYLAKRLRELNISVTFVEQDKARCQELTELLDDVLVIHGDGTDIHLLEEESLGEMDAFVGTTGFDEENLLMALMAKQAGVRKTIAKISRPNYAKVIDKLDIDAAFNPIYISASEILKFIRGGKVVSVSLLLGGNGEVTEIVVGKGVPIIGKALEELKLPKGIIIGAIVNDNEVIIPNGKSVINENDRIIVFCLTEDLPTLRSFLKSPKGGIFSELWNRTKGNREHSDS